MSYSGSIILQMCECHLGTLPFLGERFSSAASCKSDPLVFLACTSNFSLGEDFLEL